MKGPRVSNRRQVAAQKFMVTVCLVVHCGLSVSATSRAVLSDFIVREWDSEDGLPAASIQDITRTPDGYVWIATTAGLARFDGMRFTVLTTNEVPAFADNRISTLLTDSAGVLWVATEAGTLARLQRREWERMPLDPRIKQKRISSLASDHRGGLWLGTAGAGLVHWESGSCDFGALTTGLPEADILQVASDMQGNIWALVKGRLAILRSNRWETVVLPNDCGTLTSLTASQAGGMHAATIFPALRDRCAGTVLHLEHGGAPAELSAYPWREGGPSPLRSVLLQDSRGGIWLGTTGNGLLRWDSKGVWQSFLAEGMHHQVNVNCLAQDETGTIWVGFARGEQLTQIRPRLVKTLSLPRAWEQTRIYAVCAAHDGSIWVGTSDAGVFRFRDGKIEHFGAAEGLGSPRISVILEDHRRNLWVGAMGGLFCLNGEHFELKQQGNVIALHEDRKGSLWIGTITGLARFVRGQDGLSTNSIPEGLKDAATALAEDNTGRLWVGTMRHGLFYLDGDRFELFQPTNQLLASADVRAMAADKNGNLWICSLDSGLFRVREGVVSHWTKADGLPSDRFHGVMEDARGNLWFSSDSGLFGASPTQFDHYVPNTSPPMVFWHLTTEDGMASNLGSRAGWPAVARSRDGRLWFPNQSAVAVFDPCEVALSQSSRPVLIEEVIVDGKVVRTGGDTSVSVRSSARQFEFHYTCANLQALERTQFRYRLEGWDTSWVNVGRRRVAYFGRLPAGQYYFQVMAAEPGGLWREAVSPLVLEVTPLFWERKWVRFFALVMMLASAGGMAWAVARIRARRRLAMVEQQRVLERERRRIAQDIHDDLGGSLTQISLFGELLRQDLGQPERAVGHAESISTTVQYISKSLDEIVWAVNPHNDTLGHLIGYIGQYAVEFLRAAGVRCLVDLPDNPPERMVPSAVRHNLFLATKEALNNVIRHATATEVRLSLTVTEQGLRMVIEDNGKGFVEELTYVEGDGLRNLKLRMAEIGGRCRIDSQLGRGTRVDFDIPWNRQA